MLAALAPPASAYTNFHPRVKNALGLFPPLNGDFSPDVASGALTPVTYHGGSVMAGGVTIHTIFWDGGGNANAANGGRNFQSAPSGSSAPTYIGMIEKFLGDVSADSGGLANVFSVLPQFAQGTTQANLTPGAYTIAYTHTGSPSTVGNLTVTGDEIIDHNAYPSKSLQCASPQAVTTCITDGQVQAEVDKVITAVGGTRGLHDIWYVFTPPDVDECISSGVCESSAYAGYHSLSDVGHGTTIYAYTGDPIVETRRVNNPGNDPQGFPDAEVSVDVVAHETVEAMTDPEGVGWMDPNGFETGDKCEFGPQFGDPQGYVANQSPYNQTIGGDKWLIQEMWANNDGNGNPDCVQSTSSAISGLPLAQVHLTQFSGTVTGSTERTNTAGDTVQVTLQRAAADGSTVNVATGSGTVGSTGSWSVTLSGGHVAGDDRDVVLVHYTGPNALADETIQTGNGGNPFTESGWTGWFDLDTGSALSNSSGGSLKIAPCFQTGVESGTLGGSPITPPHGNQYLTDFCDTQTDVSTVPGLGTVSKSSSGAVTVSTLDDRAFVPPDAPNPNTTGALVSLTVPVGEPDAVSPFASPLADFTPTGLANCTGDLEMQTVTCTGLVAGDSYAATDGSKSHSAVADPTGTVSIPLAIKGGDTVALTNSAHRTLTTLHLAHLKAAITAEQTVLGAGSTCQANQYMQGPLNAAPTNGSAGGPGVALTGSICPSSGNAAGFPASPLVQTDELSGGATTTEVPDIQDTSPLEAEIVYGTFTAVAESGFPGPNNSVTPDTTSKIALSIRPARGGKVVFKSSNVNKASGVKVAGIKPGTYKATWTLTDLNGDTRVLTTRFVEESGTQGPRGKQGPPGPTPHIHCVLQKHNKIKCTVTFKRSVKGTLHLRIARAGQVAALGHGNVRSGRATVMLRELHRLTGGSWTMTIVLIRGNQSTTERTTLHVA